MNFGVYVFPMRFGFVGNNEAASSILKEFAACESHSLLVAAISGSLPETAGLAGVRFQLVSSPEDVFLDSGVETVIVAMSDTEDALRLARAASQAGKHVAMLPPVNVSPAFSFELHLILDESNHAIVPVTGRWALEELNGSEPCLSYDRTTVQQLVMDLPLDTADADKDLERTLYGLDLLAATGFKYTQVTAIQSMAPSGVLLSQLVTLNSQASAEQPQPPALLNLKPGSIGEISRPVLSLHLIDGSRIPLTITQTPRHLDRIAMLCEQRDKCGRWMESFSEVLELVEAVRKSLRRRRTVDVHFDSGSERGVFKSQMTAMGCGVLIYMMFGMVAYLIVAQLADLPDWVLHGARVLWIAPMIIFLLAQALLPLARDRSSDRS